MGVEFIERRLGLVRDPAGFRPAASLGEAPGSTWRAPGGLRRS
jgi:hypothetical protein